MTGTPSPSSVSTKLLRIAELARQWPERPLTTLAHHIDVEWLREAYRATRKDGATGVDEQTAADYTTQLEDNLQSLLDRFKSGTYHAPPARRVYIPKGDGRMRPIGIPTFEDKVLQRAVATVLDAVYEQEFLPCSYGFRPGRSAHQALRRLWELLTEMGGGWVWEVDIQGFFDTLDHGQLRHFLDRRVRDGVLRRVIDKWLKAGVLEGGELHHPDSGTPQGGVISPLLANVYLHEVLDKWFAEEVRPRLRGKAELIRYADDFVLVFSSEADARRVWDVLPKRFGRYNLTLHPQKTRLIAFRRPPPGTRPRRRERPGSFDLLGFTHHWERSRYGRWVLRQRTMSRRLSRALTAIAQWCRSHRHQTIRDQQRGLARKLQGHYAYYGITGNFMALYRFALAVRSIWRKWLDRRSQRARMSWERFLRLEQRYPLPRPRIAHSVYARAANP